jgi:sulfate adenylyltransferase
MSRADYDRVLDELRLADGTVFPIPITLPVEDPPPVGTEISLRNSRNELLGVMTVEEIFDRRPDEAERVAGTTDSRHPLVAEMVRWPSKYISGPLQVLQLPTHHDFVDLRRTPAEVRALLAERGRANVVAFQTRNPLHRAHEELTRQAIDAVDGVLLLHPVVGLTKPGDIDHYTRVRTYKALVENHYPPDRVVLSLLPLAMRMAGPREALWHAIIRGNYGVNHFIVGRDHASPGPFYGPYDAQELVAKYEDEIGVKMIPFREVTGPGGVSISGTQVREDYLAKGRPLPEWFTRPEVAAILAEAHPPRHREGFCLWFTGLSGAGKSTTADIVVTLLLEDGRQSTVLDGDVVRTHLSKGLGFSKEDRDANILRIGFVAAEVVRHGGVAVCAAVSPYRATRDMVRQMVGAHRFFEIFVDTPLEVCEERDVKGMYAQARAGIVKNFTGVDDPYEAPLAAEMTLYTVSATPQANARAIVGLLRERGFLRT